MHIAVCDDNTADRHQMERILKRESEQRRGISEPLYIDSFGNSASLLNNPMLYDLFYIDICKTEGVTGMDVAEKLMTKGVNASIVMCCSDINYREQSFSGNVHFLDKPIKTDELHASIEYAQEIIESFESKIELREDTETFYVTEPDILYAVEKNGITTVTLASGRKISLVSTASNFFAQIECYPSFSDATPKVILNCRYIQKIASHKASMIDGAAFKIDRIAMPYTKEMFAKLHSSESTK